MLNKPYSKKNFNADLGYLKLNKMDCLMTLIRNMFVNNSGGVVERLGLILP